MRCWVDSHRGATFVEQASRLLGGWVDRVSRIQHRVSHAWPGSQSAFICVICGYSVTLSPNVLVEKPTDLGQGFARLRKIGEDLKDVKCLIEELDIDDDAGIAGAARDTG